MIIRNGRPTDAAAIHALVCAHEREGHLLPRRAAEIERHAARFVVCEHDGEIKACAELAPLSPVLAEVRSLVVSRDFRRVGLATRMLQEVRARAEAGGFERLCAFTHDARPFVRQNFSIVPHVWLPEKVSTDCLGCPLFRQCTQYAMVLPLQEVVRYLPAEAPAAARVAVA